MTAMAKYRTITEAHRACMSGEVEMSGPGGEPIPAFLVRPDGDTYRYDRDDRGKVTRTKIVGWETCGMSIDPGDCPCVIYGATDR